MEGTREGLCSLRAVKARHGDVFFNALQVLQRDLSVLCLRAHFEDVEGIRVLDAMCGGGVRAVRYALEVPGVARADMIDLDEESIMTARETVAHSVATITRSSDMSPKAHAFVSKMGSPQISCGLGKKIPTFDVRCGDCNSIMSASKSMYDVIDLDPCGSPAPFLDAAIRALRCDRRKSMTANVESEGDEEGVELVGGLLCVASTEDPSLDPKLCQKRYGGRCFTRTAVTGSAAGTLGLGEAAAAEVHIRLLLNRIRMAAAACGRTVTPLLSLNLDFFRRVYVRIDDFDVNQRSMLKVRTDTKGGDHAGRGVTQNISSIRWPFAKVHSRRNHHDLVEGENATFEWEALQNRTLANSRYSKMACQVTKDEGSEVAGPMDAGPLHDAKFVLRLLSALKASSFRKQFDAGVESLNVAPNDRNIAVVHSTARLVALLQAAAAEAKVEFGAYNLSVANDTQPKNLHNPPISAAPLCHSLQSLLRPLRTADTQRNTQHAKNYDNEHTDKFHSPRKMGSKAVDRGGYIKSCSELPFKPPLASSAAILAAIHSRGFEAALSHVLEAPAIKSNAPWTVLRAAVYELATTGITEAEKPSETEARKMHNIRVLKSIVLNEMSWTASAKLPEKGLISESEGGCMDTSSISTTTTLPPPPPDPIGLPSAIVNADAIDGIALRRAVAEFLELSRPYSKKIGKPASESLPSNGSKGIDQMKDFEELKGGIISDNKDINKDNTELRARSSLTEDIGDEVKHIAKRMRKAGSYCEQESKSDYLLDDEEVQLDASDQWEPLPRCEQLILVGDGARKAVRKGRIAHATATLEASNRLYAQLEFSDGNVGRVNLKRRASQHDVKKARDGERNTLYSIDHRDERALLWPIEAADNLEEALRRLRPYGVLVLRRGRHQAPLRVAKICEDDIGTSLSPNTSLEDKRSQNGSSGAGDSCHLPGFVIEADGALLIGDDERGAIITHASSFATEKRGRDYASKYSVSKSRQPCSFESSNARSHLATGSPGSSSDDTLLIQACNVCLVGLTLEAPPPPYQGHALCIGGRMAKHTLVKGCLLRGPTNDGEILALEESTHRKRNQWNKNKGKKYAAISGNIGGEVTTLRGCVCAADGASITLSGCHIFGGSGQQHQHRRQRAQTGNPSNSVPSSSVFSGIIGGAGIFVVGKATAIVENSCVIEGCRGAGIEARRGGVVLLRGRSAVLRCGQPPATIQNTTPLKRDAMLGNGVANNGGLGGNIAAVWAQSHGSIVVSGVGTVVGYGCRGNGLEAGAYADIVLEKGATVVGCRGDGAVAAWSGFIDIKTCARLDAIRGNPAVAFGSAAAVRLQGCILSRWGGTAAMTAKYGGRVIVCSDVFLFRGIHTTVQHDRTKDEMSISSLSGGRAHAALAAATAAAAVAAGMRIAAADSAEMSSRFEEGNKEDDYCDTVCSVLGTEEMMPIKIEEDDSSCSATLLEEAFEGRVHTLYDF